MTEFTKGQHVKVKMEFEGTLVDPAGPKAWWVVTPNPDTGVPSQRLMFECEMEVLEPAGWPPQLGDVWEAEGEEYYVRKYTMSTPTPMPVVVQSFDKGPAYSDAYGNPRNLPEFKALNPHLVRRRGEGE